MKLLKLTLIVFLLIAITALHSCKPEPPDPPPTDLGFFGLGEAKDYVYFKKGTWWVYQNTRTKEYDTIEVTNNLLDTLEATSKKWHIREELFLITSKSLSTGYTYKLSERQGAVEVINQPKGYTIPTMVRDNPYEGELEPFYYPFNILPKKADAGYNTFCLTIKDTMMIDNKKYEDVAVFYIKSNGTEPLPLKHKPEKYFWARNYGIVKRELFDSKFFGDTSSLYHSWKLINSNIIQ
jgi:hypothetical protein